MTISAPDHTHLHATCVSIGGKGVVLLGESGSGKSDLALRLIDGGATLVGDDQLIIRTTQLTGEDAPPTLTLPHKGGGTVLTASPAGNIHGMIEARGVGILHLPYVQNVPVALAVKLVERNAVERMPEPQFFDCLGLQVALLSLHAFDHSTAAKIRLFLLSLSH